MNIRIACILMGAGSCFLSTSASALNAFDKASNYGFTFTNGMNKGYGFKPWQFSLTNPSNALNGFFIGDSNQNGSETGPGINTAGVSWGAYANSGQTATLSRDFITPLSANDVFQLKFDNGFMESGGQVGIIFWGELNQVAAKFWFANDSTHYKWADSAGTSNTGIWFEDGGIDLTLMNNGAGSFDISMTSLYDDLSDFRSGTYANGQQTLTGFSLFNINAGGGPERVAYINNLQVVPEPNSLVAMAILAAGLRTRRRN